MKTFIQHILLKSLLFLFLIYGCSYHGNNRDSLMKPEMIMDTIGVEKGMKIGEIGAGEGYFTFKLSKRVGPAGKIYANDIRQSVLDTIQNRIKKENIENIIVLLGSTEDPYFPEENFDLIVMMLVYHELEKPVIYFQNLKKYLKPGGTVVVIERDPERWGQGEDHFMKTKEILDTVEESDYELVRMETFLEIDNIFIFRPIEHR